MVLRAGLTTTPAVLIGSIIAFVLLAIPSLLAGAYAGLESVGRESIDAARAIGMTELQILFKVEIPLGLPVIIGGIRSATLQVIATVTIASYVGLGGLGRIISSGIGLNDYTVILGGALLVTVLALGVDGVFAILQRLTRTRGQAARPLRNVQRKRSDAAVAPTLDERTPA
jgi:osmoprotectant transport system permease protein